MVIETDGADKRPCRRFRRFGCGLSLVGGYSPRAQTDVQEWFSSYRPLTGLYLLSSCRSSVGHFEYPAQKCVNSQLRKKGWGFQMSSTDGCPHLYP